MFSNIVHPCSIVSDIEGFEPFKLILQILNCHSQKMFAVHGAFNGITSGSRSLMYIFV